MKRSAASGCRFRPTGKLNEFQSNGSNANVKFDVRVYLISLRLVTVLTKVGIALIIAIWWMRPLGDLFLLPLICGLTVAFHCSPIRIAQLQQSHVNVDV
jgi:hypothetical protein